MLYAHWTNSTAISNDTLFAFEHGLASLSSQLGATTPDVTAVLQDLRRWLSLSKELLAARLAATRTIRMRVECDRYLPNIIIRNQGKADVTLTAEESAEFQGTLAEVSVTLEQSFNDNTRIEGERVSLSKQLFSDDAAADSSSTPAQQAQPDTNAIKPLHPLEGKTWFRLVKVLYVCLWALVVGLCLLIGISGENVASALITGVVATAILILLRKGFYYVALGRTTVAERPGTGYLDWDELNASFEQLRATYPDMYKSAVEPFLTSWKQQYGRRVPVHAYEALRKRAAAELEQLRSKKQQVIDDAAKRGATIEISSLRERMEKTKAEYQGPDRAAHVRAIDVWIMQLEATYGTSIPVDDASRLVDELEQRIQEEEK